MTFSIHILWLWVWFSIGLVIYWLKRAYFVVSGPNPAVTNYLDFFKKFWIPLLVRAFIDSLLYWLLFTPGFGTKLLSYLGWSDYEWVITVVTSVAPFAAIFGLAIDSVVDLLVTRIPYVKDWLPKMP